MWHGLTSRHLSLSLLKLFYNDSCTFCFHSAKPTNNPSTQHWISVQSGISAALTIHAMVTDCLLLPQTAAILGNCKQVHKYVTAVYVSYCTKAICGLTNGTSRTGHYTADGHQHPPDISLQRYVMVMMIPNIGSNMVRPIIRIEDVASENVYPHWSFSWVYSVSPGKCSDGTCDQQSVGAVVIDHSTIHSPS